MTIGTNKAGARTAAALARAALAKAGVCAAAIMGCLVVASGSASAAVMSLPPIYFGSPTAQQTSFVDPESAAQFNPLIVGQPLQGVIITLNDSIATGPGGSVQCQTPGVQSGQCSGTITSTATISLTLPSVFNLTLVSTTPSTSFPYLITGQNTVSIPTGSATGFNNASFVTGDGNPFTSIILAAFSGSGNVSLGVSGTGNVSAVNGDGFVLSGNPIFGSGEVDITYLYAPEPASLAVLGVALSGLGIIRRRRKA